MTFSTGIGALADASDDLVVEFFRYTTDDEEDDDECDDEDLAGDATAAVLILFLHMQQHHENSCSLASESEMGGLWHSWWYSEWHSAHSIRRFRALTSMRRHTMHIRSSSS